MLPALAPTSLTPTGVQHLANGLATRAMSFLQKSLSAIKKSLLALCMTVFTKITQKVTVMGARVYIDNPLYTYTSVHMDI